MLTFLGLIILIVVVVSYTLSNIQKGFEEDNERSREFNRQLKLARDRGDRYSVDFKTIKTIPTFKLPGRNWMWISLAIFLMVLSASNPIGKNAYSYRQVVENPISGSTWVQFNQGFYFKGFFSSTTTYPDAVTVVYAKPENAPDEEVSSLNLPVEIRFSDAAKAISEATVKWRLSNNEEEMLLTHKDNRSSQKLTNTMLEPFTSECLGFAAQLMESETHYSGGKSKMAEDFQTQLEEGQYIIVTKSEYVKDTVSNTARNITFTEVRRDVNGVPIRKKSNIKQYGIKLVTATIKSVDYDAIIDEKLKSKIEASTRESISKQEAITAEQEAITAKIEGEKLIAETTARENSAKLQAVIRAEMVKEVAAENKETAILDAAAELATKTAQAAGDRLKVQAGLSPKEQAEFDMNTAIGVAQAMAGPNGITFPMINAGNGGQGGGALQTVELKMYYDLIQSMSKTKK
jgi:regulator of protease activity HflC (stomatin/prohibitin superfamily)